MINEQFSPKKRRTWRVIWMSTLFLLILLALIMLPRVAGAQAASLGAPVDGAKIEDKSEPDSGIKDNIIGDENPADRDADCEEKTRHLRMQLRFQEAEKIGRACAEAQPDDPDIWVEVGRALAAQQKTGQARAWVDQGLERFPDDPGLTLLKARLLAWDERLSESRALLETLPPATFEHPEAMSLRADVLLWDQDFSQAVKWYNRYDMADRDNPLVLYRRAQAYRGMGKTSLALRDLRRSCEIAPQATVACEARADFSQSAYPKVYANAFYGYSRVIERLDGWRVRGALGSEINRNLTLLGTWEWLHRPFFDHRADDWRFNASGEYEFDSGLVLMAGGGFSPDPIFSPKWNALVEAGWKFERFKLTGRLWHIEFPDQANEVFNANGELYFKPFMLEGRYFLTFAPDDNPAHSGFGRLFYFFSDLTQLYVGGGGGQKSDYLEPRDVQSQSHWLFTGGFRLMLSDHHRLMLSLTQRHDSANELNYDQTETMLGYEFRL